MLTIPEQYLSEEFLAVVGPYLRGQLTARTTRHFAQRQPELLDGDLLPSDESKAHMQTLFDYLLEHIVRHDSYELADTVVVLTDTHDLSSGRYPHWQHTGRLHNLITEKDLRHE